MLQPQIITYQAWKRAQRPSNLTLLVCAWDCQSPERWSNLPRVLQPNGWPAESRKVMLLNRSQLKNASKESVENLPGHMGGTLWRRIICCWSILRAKTVSIPVQSLCSWIQNIVNAFGMDYKDDTDLTVAGRGTKCDRGHPLSSARDPAAAK